MKAVHDCTAVRLWSALLFLVMTMLCNEFEKMIPDFLAGSLVESDLAAFVEHVDACEDCKEELTIQLLVTEGMDRLESGASFNLQDSVEKKVNLGRTIIFRGIRRRKVLYFMETLIICGLGACFWLCFYARG